MVKFCVAFVFEIFKSIFHLFNFSLSKQAETTDKIDGHRYEHIVANHLKKMGYNGVSVTKASGDYGVDVIASKGGRKYAVQCKYYSNPVGVEAIQQAVAGMAMYGCSNAMVVTNNTFTAQARTLASKNHVVLLENVKP